MIGVKLVASQKMQSPGDLETRKGGPEICSAGIVYRRSRGFAFHFSI